MYSKTGFGRKKQSRQWIAGLLCAAMLFEGSGMQVLAQTQPAGSVETEMAEVLEVSEEGTSGTDDGTDDGEEVVESGVYRGMDWKINSAGEMTISGNYDETAGGRFWGTNLDVVSVKVTATNVKSTNYWFLSFISLERADFSEFDTSQVTTMDEMFADCRSLISLDLSGFDMSLVESADWFLGENLENINTPKNLAIDIALPVAHEDSAGNIYMYLPKNNEESISLGKSDECAAKGTYKGMDCGMFKATEY